jgi:hypothetical protein
MIISAVPSELNGDIVNDIIDLFARQKQCRIRFVYYTMIFSEFFSQFVYLNENVR